MKDLLSRYARARGTQYQTRDAQDLAHIDQETVELQTQLWHIAIRVAEEKPNPIGALVVNGMNDVMNLQDYSEAARINHIPLGVWVLMIVIAMFGCTVQGYGARGKLRKGMLIIVLPMAKRTFRFNAHASTSAFPAASDCVNDGARASRATI